MVRNLVICTALLLASIGTAHAASSSNPGCFRNCAEVAPNSHGYDITIRDKSGAITASSTVIHPLPAGSPVVADQVISLANPVATTQATTQATTAAVTTTTTIQPMLDGSSVIVIQTFSNGVLISETVIIVLPNGKVGKVIQ